MPIIPIPIAIASQGQGGVPEIAGVTGAGVCLIRGTVALLDANFESRGFLLRLAMAINSTVDHTTSLVLRVVLLF